MTSGQARMPWPVRVAALVALAVAGSLSTLDVRPAAASCRTLASGAEAFERAEVVFEGELTPQPTDDEGYVLSPGEFRVARYLKGDGPDHVTVETWAHRTPEGDVGYTPSLIDARAGEAWRIYGAEDELEPNHYQTSTCAGSRRLATDYGDACPAGVPEDGFRDVPFHGLAEPVVDCATWWGVVGGVSGTRFAPEWPVTRGQMASFVARTVTAAGRELPEAPLDHFVDDQGSVHEQAINQLAAEDLVEGTGPLTYSPEVALSRGQAAAMVVRVHAFVTGRELPATQDHFDDDDGSVHEDAINAAAEAGLVTGVAPGRFAPAQAASRAQLAVLLTRLLDDWIGSGEAAPHA